jgi:hypothetical protein
MSESKKASNYLKDMHQRPMSGVDCRPGPSERRRPSRHLPAMKTHAVIRSSSSRGSRRT